MMTKDAVDQLVRDYEHALAEARGSGPLGPVTTLLEGLGLFGLSRASADRGAIERLAADPLVSTDTREYAREALDKLPSK